MPYPLEIQMTNGILGRSNTGQEKLNDGHIENFKNFHFLQEITDFFHVYNRCMVLHVSF